MKTKTQADKKRMLGTLKAIKDVLGMTDYEQELTQELKNVIKLIKINY